MTYLIGIPINTTSSVGIRVNQGDALEASGGLDSRDADRITNELGIVELDERRADRVGARWEIDQCWGDCGRVAALTATRAGSNCSVDCRSIISGSVSSSTKVLHISEHLISRTITISNRALPGNRCDPIAGCGSIACSWGRNWGWSGCPRNEEE